MTILAFALAAMSLLAPGRDHHVLAEAIAHVIEAEKPIFAADESKLRTTAYLVAVGFRESSLRVDAVGDDGASFCAYQIHRSSGGTAALLHDADACVATAFAMLRASALACPAYPTAIYAEGPRGCSSERARRISRDRVALARWLLTRVEVTP